jgi:hypothetical protein
MAHTIRVLCPNWSGGMPEYWENGSRPPALKAYGSKRTLQEMFSFLSIDNRFQRNIPRLPRSVR